MRDTDRRLLAAAAILLFGGLFGTRNASADQQDDVAERLRAALRQATVELRDLEDQNATLLARQSEAVRDHLTLTQKLAADEKELQELRDKMQSRRTALQQSADELAKLQVAYKNVAGLAQERDADIKRFSEAQAALRDRNRFCEDKNGELYKLGQEVLNLYDNKGFLDVAGGDEPVTKLKRVEYETIIQDYQNKLRDNHIVPPTE